MAVTTAPILASPQDSEPFRIEADSSDFTSEAVLSQKLPGEEKWHLVAVRETRAEHSRRFLSLNYTIEWVTTHLQEIPQRIR